ncbi:helix-turn-helix domain-containing protein [Xanthovirga aplysinae]|uniref:helix-turn-helix domain-containing protein n=1 Tax=Xanthovirga aplysinae TaxID=2529853 RepID=UPI0012BC2BC8|nr:helix-turn-helix domain-containing protein [Xanthovirga aplysinae]MTI33096.1 AraC family transcriptional regulator [Xanthovirga aplysinae]
MENIPIRDIKEYQKEQNFSNSFNIRDIRPLLGGKDMIQELHRHDFFFVLALQKGKGNHEIDFISYEVCDHSVYFLRPGQVHRLTLKSGSTGFLMAFKADIFYPHDKVFNERLRKASNVNHYPLDATRFTTVQAVLDFIFREYTVQQEGYESVIIANLGIIIIELIRQISESPSNSTSLYKQERLEEFLELLEKHSSKYKQVSQYADLLNLSPFQLNAITKTTLGKTSSVIINDHIILESKRYLLATSNQVNEIAYQLGYEDISYFIRFFKKQTGYTPEAFRNNFR